jgi:hypothetical protein
MIRPYIRSRGRLGYMGLHGVGEVQAGVDAEEFYGLAIIREGGCGYSSRGDYAETWCGAQAMEARGMMWVASVAVV